MGPSEPQNTQPGAAPAAPQPAPPAGGAQPAGGDQPSASGTDPGKTLGIIGLVMAFIFPLIGVVLSGLAMSKSKKAGHKNTIAVIGLVLNIIFLVFSVLIFFMTLSNLQS